MKRCATLLVLLAVVLAGCSSSGKRPDPSPLPVFEQSLKAREQWSGGLGSLGDSLLRPAFAGASVYAAGQSGRVARFDAAGQQVWRVSAGTRLAGGVASDGSLVVVSGANGELIALDAADGSKRWQVPLGGEALGTPLIAEDLVVVRVGDFQVAAYGVADGKRRWVYQRAQSPLTLRTYTGLARSGDFLLVGFSGGKLVALSLSAGLQRWEASIAQPRGANELERMADVVGDPLLLGDMVCASAFQGRVACVERSNGQLRWGRDLPSAVGIAAADDKIYVTDADDAVLALDASTGATFWKQDKLAYRQLVRPLVVGAHLVVADAQGYIHVMDRQTGQFVARVRADSSGAASPLLSLPNHGFALQTRDGELSAWSLQP